MLQILKEAKDLNLYKRLLRVLAGYSDKFPATGVSKMYRKAVDLGMKIMPKDKRAQIILSNILSTDDSVPAAVTRLLNLRFSDLEVGNGKPIYKNGTSKEVAFWSKDGQVYDKIMSLLNTEGKSGIWSDAQGNKVSLVDLESVVTSMG